MKRILLSAVALFAAQMASASAVTYTGRPFAETYEGAGSVTATFEFATPLVSGATLTAADLVSFSITSLGKTVTSADAFSFSAFDFNIGADGLPTAWRVAVEMNIEGGSAPEQWSTLYKIGDYNLDAFSRDDYYANSYVPNGAGYSVIWSTPGTWAVAAAVPEPSSMALAALGICALVVARRRKSQDRQV